MTDFKTYAELEKHQQTLAEKLLYFLIGRCGSGKTRKVTEALAAAQKVNPKFTIWATKDIKLQNQTYSTLAEFGCTNVVRINSKLIADYDDRYDLLRRTLGSGATGAFNGIVLITHEMLFNIYKDEHLYHYAKESLLFIDEMPKNAAKALVVTQYDETKDTILKFCEVSTTQVSKDGSQYIKLKENLSEELKQELGLLIKHHNLDDEYKRDKTYTKEVIAMLKLIREGKEITYYISNDEEGKARVHTFRAVVREKLDALVDNIGSNQAVLFLASSWKTGRLHCSVS
ncbi:DEAD/DEAH box helicase family protein [Vibrio sp. VNB-15]